MSKETSHRGDELKGLGWSEADVARYVELWEYRQRWGAMNLEREDRLFLRKAEKALPAIVTGRAEAGMGLGDGERGAWPVLLEAELRLLDHYEPVLGLPDTLKAKALSPVREKLTAQVAALGNTKAYDFQAPLIALKAEDSSNRWKHLREVDASDRTYPLLSADGVAGFRSEAHRDIQEVIRNTFPSLAETDKPELSDD